MAYDDKEHLYWNALCAPQQKMCLYTQLGSEKGAALPSASPLPLQAAASPTSRAGFKPCAGREESPWTDQEPDLLIPLQCTFL